MSIKYILAIDAGTSGIRTMLYDYHSREVASTYKTFTQFTPAPGLLEHDPLEIWDVTANLMNETLRKAQASAEDIAAIGVTGQRASVIAWDKTSGHPIHNAIVWQDIRTRDRCKELTKQIGFEVSTISAYTKFEWLLNNVPQCRENVQNGDVLIGTLDTWLIWNLTGGESFVTDPSNAVTTMMWLPPTGKWSPELAQLIGMPVEKLATIVPTSHVCGTAAKEVIGARIPVAAVAGDQQAAMFGHLCREPGEGKATYGTSVMVNVNTGKKWTPSKKTNVLALWRIDDEDHFCQEGTVITGGASVSLVQELRILENVEESLALAESVSDSGGIFFIPALQGLGTPYMDPTAKGALLGLTRASTRAHVARAVLESIAFRTRQVVETLRESSPVPALETLQVDGGMAGNDAFLQMQADVLGTNVQRPNTNQVTSLGIAYLAGLAVGFWTSETEIKKTKAPGKVFTPSDDAVNMQERYQQWVKAVDVVRELGTTDLEKELEA
ncbi:FGGY family carbohydrate kinase [Salicibibacter kimchii]|uniref:Glycerol kinase n=1 Tax=Salicibibacter kimchii TaxID=2099786 RepID=A0A345BVK2_9BACI|nr:FGGY family carbohydrate kinase [Salicibibacter kimchii]AXF54983.1 glycerol kinase [Salicibibacter kimchii]